MKDLYELATARNWFHDMVRDSERDVWQRVRPDLLHHEPPNSRHFLPSLASSDSLTIFADMHRARYSHRRFPLLDNLESLTHYYADRYLVAGHHWNLHACKLVVGGEGGEVILPMQLEESKKSGIDDTIKAEQRQQMRFPLESARRSSIPQAATMVSRTV